MNKRFKLEILTPDRKFFDGEAESLTVNTTHGEMGVIYNTQSMVAALNLGICKYRIDDDWTEIMLGDGFIEVHPHGARVFAQFAVTPEEFEQMEDKGDYNLADELAKKAQSRREYKMAKAQLARQFSNLRNKTKRMD